MARYRHSSMRDDYDVIKGALRQAYDRDVMRRDGRAPDAWRTGLIDQFAVELRQRALHSVIELGAGTGQLAQHLRGQGFEVLATDLSPGNVAAIRRRGLVADVVDFSALPYNDATFDAVLAMNSLLHVPKGARLHEVMGGIRRILRPGGLALIVVWGGRDLDGHMDNDWLEPPRYFSLYADETFHDLAFAGFTTVRSEVLDVMSGDLHPQVKLLEAR
jgi:SAM-dependent methyltransferase